MPFSEVDAEKMNDPEESFNLLGRVGGSGVGAAMCESGQFNAEGTVS
jgi:hypothetical protein